MFSLEQKNSNNSVVLQSFMFGNAGDAVYESTVEMAVCNLEHVYSAYVKSVMILRTYDLTYTFPP